MLLRCGMQDMLMELPLGNSTSQLADQISVGNNKYEGLVKKGAK